MATPTHQRVFIIVLAVVMLVGTIGSFAALILANQNQPLDQQRQEEQQQKMLEEYQKQLAEEQKKNRPLDGYEAAAFEADEVTELEVEVLKKGDGEEVTEQSTISANYFGWQADGTIFDSTKKVDQDATPIEFSLQGVIEGWTEGLSGRKVGDVVRLTIPAEQAYGNEDTGFGQPTGPLKFIVSIEDIVAEEASE